METRNAFCLVACLLPLHPLNGVFPLTFEHIIISKTKFNDEPLKKFS